MVADAEDVPPITASPIPNCHWLLQFLTAEIYPSSLIQTFPKCGKPVAVAVRSSATAEDLPTASFAGQHESFLNVHGEAEVIEACRQCFASIFTDRAIVYRIINGFDHFKVALSVGVMKMVRSDLAASGVVFTLDTESGFRDVVFVTGRGVSARTSYRARS